MLVTRSVGEVYRLRVHALYKDATNMRAMPLNQRGKSGLGV